jgi:transcriptional regulator with XRE-family HTH domain
MNRVELQQLKLAWIAAREADDIHTQVALLRDHPEAQADLIDFIAAYSATKLEPESGEEQAALLPLTQRASQTALERVFTPRPMATNLQQLRMQRGLTMISTARGLRLSVDVWKKFEAGAIELASLSEKQLQRLAHFFQVPLEQFSTLLHNSQPTFALNRRQTAQAARSKQQGLSKSSFAEAVEKSTMSKEEKQLWLERP